MIPEEPSFSTKPLSESEEQDVKPKKNKRKSGPKKTKVDSSFIKDDSEHNKQTKLSQQLSEIYQDNEGRLPDMKKIKIKQNNSSFKTFFTVIFIGGLLAAAAWAGFFFMPNNKKFSEDQIKLKIDGPQTVISGTSATYKISYENNQSIALKNVTLNVQYPEGFIFVSSDIASKNSGHTEWQLNEIGARRKKEINITGLVYGSLNQKKSWRAFLTYQPENFGSELQKVSSLEIAIGKSPFILSVNGPSKATLGNSAEYIFTLKKEEASQIAKLELKPSWPQNFSILSSSPALSKDYKWVIDPNKTTSSTNENLTFKLVGKFSNSPTSSNDISATLFAINNNSSFALANAKATTDITQNDLDFNLAINGSLTNFSSKPGENLNITLSLKNQSPDDLKNVTLKLTLDAPSTKKQSLLNWAKIQDKFDGDIQGIQINDTTRRGEIVWDKNKIPNLTKIDKNKEISIDVQLPIKDGSSFDLTDLKTPTKITAVAEISFKDADNIARTYSSNQINITVNSDLKFEARDSVSGNNGERHQINWILTNSFHPLKNLTLTADVYGDVNVEIPLSIPAGKANFNSSNKKITWTIPEMPESVDTLALPITVTLNKVNPTQNLLVSKTHIQADDTITGEKIDFMGEEVGLKP